MPINSFINQFNNNNSNNRPINKTFTDIINDINRGYKHLLTFFETVKDKHINN